MKNTFLLVLSPATASLTVTGIEGCTTRRVPARFTWVGNSVKNLVYRTGPPTTTQGDDNGGQIFI